MTGLPVVATGPRADAGLSAAAVPDGPVTSFVASLGTTLAEQWLTGLALPGVVYVAVVAVAVRTGREPRHGIGLVRPGHGPLNL